MSEMIKSSDFDPDHPLKSSLEIPEGRSIYIEFMLKNDKENETDDGYTEEENKILFGLQFDETLSHRLMEDETITKKIYQLTQDGANYQKSQINKARLERKLATK
jgi:hypothetical protein